MKIPLLLTLLAFALRLWRVDAQSLRGDEAFDVLFARQSLGEIIYQDRFNQIYPPLYHTLDHFWLMLAGVPELSARFIALWAGVLVVPLTYQLARRLSGERVARVAALLVALHPFLIWHSQDGRMYTLLAMFSLLATLCALRIWQTADHRPPMNDVIDYRIGRILKYRCAVNSRQHHPRRARSAPRKSGAGTLAKPACAGWVLVGAGRLCYVLQRFLIARPRILLFTLYIFVSTLNVLNHYFAFFSVFAVNVAALYLWWRRKWPLKFYAQWFAANAVVGIVAAIWVALAWTRIAGHSEPWIAPTSPLDVLARSLLAYSLGTTMEWAHAWPWLMAMMALVALGLWPDRRPRLRGAVRPPTADRTGPTAVSGQPSVVALLTFVPLFVIYFGSLWRPMYDEKFLIFIVPFYMMLVARGLVVIGSIAHRGRLTGTRPYATVIALVFVVGGMILSLFNYHFDPQFAKSPPWREAAHWLLAQARAGDVVVYNFPDPALPYQIGERLPLVLLPAQGPGDPAVAKPLDAASAESELAQLSAQYERIWFVPQPSPNWDADGAVARWLSRFADREDEPSFGALKVERFLTPRAYQKLWTPLNAQFVDGVSLMGYRVSLSPDMVRLTLYWQATRPVSKDYTVFAHLLNDAGVLVAQQDNPPVNGDYPTSQWTTGNDVVDRYAIIMPADLPHGRYRFEVGLYDANGTRLRVGSDDKIVFGEVIK